MSKRMVSRAQAVCCARRSAWYISGHLFGLLARHQGCCVYHLMTPSYSMFAMLVLSVYVMCLYSVLL